jgi:hypothetical protein
MRRTTIRLRDDLLRRAKRRAAEEQRTLTSLIEEGVSLVLARPAGRRRSPTRMPISRASGGVLPGIDLNHSAALEAAMDES